jgi:bifunctional N-acetylglucosamine-1-phosphate-uridyltransferase/glucosamine-1-phosphate-acetyltransferase GlmU-like protein
VWIDVAFESPELASSDNNAIHDGWCNGGGTCAVNHDGITKQITSTGRNTASGGADFSSIALVEVYGARHASMSGFSSWCL